MWQARKACADSLRNYNVRVSILLRLGLQREDGTFSLPESRRYNERYEERREDLWNVKISENSCQECNVGSLELIGDRITILGGNMYTLASEKAEACRSKRRDASGRGTTERPVDKGSKAELGMLAIQLGSEADASTESPARKLRPFALQLFPENDNGPDDRVVSGVSEEDEVKAGSGDEAGRGIEATTNNEYRAQLDHIYAELIVESEPDETVSRKMELLDLMDQLK